MCLIVFVMGWSWACWGAQTVTEDVFVRGVSLLYQSARVCHGRPTPHIGPDQPDLWSAHIDDDSDGVGLRQGRERSSGPGP